MLDKKAIGFQSLAELKKKGNSVVQGATWLAVIGHYCDTKTGNFDPSKYK